MIRPRDVHVTGVGRSETGRALHRSPVDLAADAILAALADAGLDRRDVGGLAAFVPDLGSAPVADVQDALGLELDWFVGCSEGGPSQLAALWMATEAVASGRVTHAVAFHASCEGSVRARAGRGGSVPGTARAMPERADGPQAWWLPFGAPSAANVVALYAQRHFATYGTTREQLGQIAVVQRENARRFPTAIYTDPLTLDDYLAARLVSEPLCLLDCDVPMDFASAVVVSRGDSLVQPDRAVRLHAYSTARRGRPSWEQGEDPATMPALHDAADALWAGVDLTPADVEVASIYDGFSFIALAWLEALGFCGRGEAGPFLEGGDRIRRGGALPINTDGGQLSSGRMHGWGYVAEVCHQLRGEAADRQVPGRRGDRPQVGLVACGGGIIGSAALLTR